MLKDKRYSETALALTECELSVLKREDLLAAKDKHEDSSRRSMLICGGVRSDMSAVYVQDNLKLQVSTPLGPNKLLLRGFRGEEQISGLFQFTLEMVSEDNAIDFQAIVGKPVTVTLNLANNIKHYLNGIVGRFVQEETNLRLTRYFAEIHPWLWLLTKTSDCRIFQNKTAGHSRNCFLRSRVH